jgi:metal-dependent HD superfamily phosphatase/phosphodiesterase
LRQSDPPKTKAKANPAPGIDAVRGSEKARLYIEMADRYLESIGYTEHGFRHADIASQTAFKILDALHFDRHDAELAAVAGYLHDIGNMAGREQHHRIGAVMAKELLEDLGFDLIDIGRVMAAIVTHEEDEGVVRFDPVTAALVLADKSDVHRSRVRTSGSISEDIHDRVNYAATEGDLTVDANSRTITLALVIDTRISQVIEYFQIFLSRMSECRKAAHARPGLRVPALHKRKPHGLRAPRAISF